MIEIHQRILRFIRGEGQNSDEMFSELAVELFDWQRARNPVLARVAEAMYGIEKPLGLHEIPALPTDVFKIDSVASFDVTLATRTFRTSGTTTDVCGHHSMLDTQHYTEAAMICASEHLLPLPKYRFLALLPSETESPASSLAFMVSRFVERWGQPDRNCFYVRQGELEVDRILRDIDRYIDGDDPIAVLGPSFGFVHLFDAVPEWMCRLPQGSVIMPTGGFKGRSREIEVDTFYEMLCERFAIEPTMIVGEYGMTELSSQAYERLTANGRWYRSPRWMRVSAVDPESLKMLPDGVQGILRVVDLANVWSSVCIQTSDLGMTSPFGFRVTGRTPGATPRGCARALDAVLLGEPSHP